MTRLESHAAWKAATVLLWSVTSLAAADLFSPASQRILLHPGAVPPLRIDFNFNFTNSLAPFRKEPSLAGKEVARGLIPTDPPTALLRNITDQELYLDSSRTEDFVDGPPARYRSTYQGHVIFRDLNVSTRASGLEIPYTLDFFTYEHGCAGWLHVRSGWSGEFEVAGRRWHCSLADNLDGKIGAQDVLYLRRTGIGARERAIAVSPIPKRLFLDGQAFDLAFTFQSGTNEVALEMQLRAVSMPLGELSMSAPGCKYVCLTNADLAAVFEAEPRPTPIPAGTYGVANCILIGDSGIGLHPVFIRSDRSVAVDPDETTSLRFGPPLRNTVQVTRDRNLLRLTYQLLGRGGEQYEYYDWRDRPRFTVYKGRLKLATGTLPFG